MCTLEFLQSSLGSEFLCSSYLKVPIEVNGWLVLCNDTGSTHAGFTTCSTSKSLIWLCCFSRFSKTHHQFSFVHAAGASKVLPSHLHDALLRYYIILLSFIHYVILSSWINFQSFLCHFILAYKCLIHFIRNKYWKVSPAICGREIFHLIPKNVTNLKWSSNVFHKVSYLTFLFCKIKHNYYLLTTQWRGPLILSDKI